MIDFLGVGISKLGILGLRQEVIAKPNHVDSTLGKETGGMAKFLQVRVAIEAVIHTPEAHGAVAAHESVLVVREPDETILPGNRLIEPRRSSSARRESCHERQRTTTLCFSRAQLRQPRTAGPCLDGPEAPA